MAGLWFFPPLAFAVVLAVVLAMSGAMKGMAFKRGPGALLSAGAAKSYACGEDMEENAFSPDYSQFFSFAFFFSIMHVVALMVATMPSGTAGSLFMPALYIGGALVGLASLLRR